MKKWMLCSKIFCLLFMATIFFLPTGEAAFYPQGNQARLSTGDTVLGGIRLGMQKSEVDAMYGRGHIKYGQPYFEIFYGNGSLQVSYYTYGGNWPEQNWIVIRVCTTENNGIRTGYSNLTVGDNQSALNNLDTVSKGPIIEKKKKIVNGMYVVDTPESQPWVRYEYQGRDKDTELHVWIDTRTNKVWKIQSIWNHPYIGV